MQHRRVFLVVLRSDWLGSWIKYLASSQDTHSQSNSICILVVLQVVISPVLSTKCQQWQLYKPWTPVEKCSYLSTAVTYHCTVWKRGVSLEFPDSPCLSQSIDGNLGCFFLILPSKYLLYCSLLYQTCAVLLLLDTKHPVILVQDIPTFLSIPWHCHLSFLPL